MTLLCRIIPFFLFPKLWCTRTIHFTKTSQTRPNQKLKIMHSSWLKVMFLLKMLWHVDFSFIIFSVSFTCLLRFCTDYTYRNDFHTRISICWYKAHLATYKNWHDISTHSYNLYLYFHTHYAMVYMWLVSGRNSNAMLLPLDQ